MSNIPVFAPCLGIDTMKHLTDALDVGWLGMGSTTKRFEDNLSKYFNLKKRFDLIFSLFGVKNINDFTSKIILIKKKAKLEDNLVKLNINIKKNTHNIIKGVNLLRLGNNPIKIIKNDIVKLISNNNS